MSFKVNILKGSLGKNIFLFTIPIMLQGILQSLYNSADLVIVGNFAENGDAALSAVGATSSIYNVMTALFMGIAVGVDVVTSFNYGRQEYEKVKKAIDTAVIAGVGLGIFAAVLGFVLAKPVLIWMNTPEVDNVLANATLYLRILMIGVPFSLLFNFCSAVFRTAGETNRPFKYLVLSGLLNVALNIVFVAGFKWGVAGVAIATVISQIVSCMLLLIRLMKNQGLFSFKIRGIQFSWKLFGKMVAIGLPAGLQSSAFSLSNVFLQSGVNSFGKDAMAAGTAVNTIEGLMWVTLSSFNNATTTFVSQNYGAGDMKRATDSVKYSLLMTIAIGLFLGLTMYFTGDQIMEIFISDGNTVAMEYARQRYSITYPAYFLAGIMSVLPGTIRGFGSSLPPSIITLLGACGIRIVWVFTIFRMFPTMTVLYLVHPITWVITNIALIINLVIVYKIAKKRIKKYKKGV
ncbi:MAG: MATE family efflux transporter [Clostridia bacterium]|nr:MATE family efflux transporter [Clostridia bacterium]